MVAKKLFSISVDQYYLSASIWCSRVLTARSAVLLVLF